MKLRMGVRSIFSFLILAGLVLGLQACGSDDPPTNVSPPPPSIASAARGYYEGFTIINVAAGNLRIDAPDFKAIVDENQFVIVYKGSEILLYKGTFTEVTATTFKADIRVYKTGIFIATAEITNGTIDITNGVILKGTLTGTGAYVDADYASSAANIELTYNNANSLAPPAYKTSVVTSWQDSPATGAVVFNYASNTKIDFILGVNNVPPELNCSALGFDTANVVNEQPGRIRKFLTSALSGCSEPTIEGQQLNGYFTNYSSSVGSPDDDRMLIVVSDNNYAYIGILPCANGTGACF